MDKVTEILHSRGKEYGDRFINIECIAELKAVWHKHRRQSIPRREAEFNHCMEMALVKIARICTGVFKDDNFNDAAGYLELARCMAKGETDVNPTR